MNKKKYIKPLLEKVYLCSDSGCMINGSIVLGNDGGAYDDIEYPIKDDGFTDFE